MNAKILKGKLRKFGFSDAAITAAWPIWWSNDAALSASANAELKFSLARKLGLDPVGLAIDDEPRFVWRDEAKFKNITSESEHERAAITSFGISVARAITTAAPTGAQFVLESAESLRNAILATQRFVRLLDLISLCWALGIPVVHLRVFPLAAKRMCAMAVRIGDRHVILLAKDAVYPAPIAYYLAHEIGHIALGHLTDNQAVVDLRDPLLADIASDTEEVSADRYALTLLTGSPEPVVTTKTRQFTAAQLAANALETGPSVGIEPGTLALCFGHSTKRWAIVNAAMRSIYVKAQDVWREVNEVAADQLNWNVLPEDLKHYVRAILGGSTKRESGSGQRHPY